MASAATWLGRVGDWAASSAVGGTTFLSAGFTAGSVVSAAWSAVPSGRDNDGGGGDDV